MPVTLVTGTSTGIGLATALHFARHGHQVVATMRNLAKAGPLEAVARDEKLPVVVRELDVTRQESIDRAMAETVAQQGPIDVLVNNAGIGGATPLELTPEDEHRAMFEANYWGPIRMIRVVLPSMRERRTGCIVNVTSIAGRIATPNQIAYSASKFALGAASEALAHEMAAFGVRVAIIEPGVIQTAIFENSAGATRYDKNSPYRQIMRRNGKLFAAGFRNPGRAETVAEVIFEAVTTERPRLRYLVGTDAEGMAAGRARISDEEWVAMGGALDDAEYNARFKRYFGIELI
ncbi:MAG TPA: SDR family oxidoreductase [Methylomirabilota bacterium]|jgi:NAD(P)-dependent dehydrogenase (short-subunit alcohol dehydrogenase family)|nr:SDR family oxidoreductase [Methylomirabilota bacterium]